MEFENPLSELGGVAPVLGRRAILKESLDSAGASESGNEARDRGMIFHPLIRIVLRVGKGSI